MAILNPTLIAHEAILEMNGNTVASDYVHRAFDSEFKDKGDTVTVRRPTTFTAEDFVQGTSPTIQGINETSVSVVLDKLATVDFKITSKELSLSIPDFRMQIITPAMNALLRKIEADILAVGRKASYAISATGALTDFTNAAQILSDNKVPMEDRFAMYSPALLNSYQQLTAFNSFQNANADTQKTGKLGPKFGFDNVMSQYLYNYTTSASGTVVTVGSTAAGSSTISVSGVTNDFIPGDSVKVGSYFYEIESATAKVGTAQTLTFGINTQAVIANNTSVVIQGAHKVNLFGHKNWATLVSAPLASYLGGVNSAVANLNGLSVRVSYGVDMDTKSSRLSFDTLYGIKLLDSAKIVKGMAF